jgi:hypothetical protein
MCPQYNNNFKKLFKNSIEKQGWLKKEKKK